MSEQELEKRVETLERELATLRSARRQSVRQRASWGIGDLPLYDVAVGPDPAKGEARGHAKGIVAIGDIATGVVALGGWARGLLAIGGLATGVISFGGASIGVLLAVGGLAIGGLSMGGAAVGLVAVGGGAAGEYACGGGAIGAHVISAVERDAEAEAFFREHHIEALCPPLLQRGRRRR